VGDYAGAIEGYREAERLNADNALAPGNRTFALYSLSRVAEAKESADTAMVKFPNNALAFATRVHVACLENDRATFDSILNTARARKMPDVLLATVQCSTRHGRLNEATNRIREVQSMFGEAAGERRGRPVVEMAFVEGRVGRAGRFAVADHCARVPACLRVRGAGRSRTRASAAGAVRGRVSKCHGPYPVEHVIGGHLSPRGRKARRRA
jgi:tetratricopeptide (TPR) repeat protein